MVDDGGGLDPGLLRAVAWGGFCGGLAFLHRFRSLREPRFLAAVDRAGIVSLVSFGAASVVAFRDRAGSMDAREKLELQKRLKAITDRASSPSAPVSSSSSSLSSSSPATAVVEFSDTDGDRIRFEVVQGVGLCYFVNGQAKLAPVTRFKSEDSTDGGGAAVVRLDGDAAGPWPSERRTMIPPPPPTRAEGSKESAAEESTAARTVLRVQAMFDRSQAQQARTSPSAASSKSSPQ